MHPVIARIGPVTIYSYGLMVALAVMAAVYVSRREASRRGLKGDTVYDLAIFIIAGGIIGARIYYLVLIEPAIFREEPLSVFKLWEGGLAIHGAILGGIIAGAIFSRIRRIHFWMLADIVAPGILLGQAIGRIGCFLNGCCYGRSTGSIFGVRFPEGSPAYIAYNGLRVHPTEIYEMALDLAGFFMLYLYIRGLKTAAFRPQIGNGRSVFRSKKPRHPGRGASFARRIRFNGGVFLVYVMTYSVIRIIVSPWRGDNIYIGSTGIGVAQTISLAAFVIALILFCIFFLRGKDGHV